MNKKFLIIILIIAIATIYFYTQNYLSAEFFITDVIKNIELGNMHNSSIPDDFINEVNNIFEFVKTKQLGKPEIYIKNIDKDRYLIKLESEKYAENGEHLGTYQAKIEILLERKNFRKNIVSYKIIEKIDNMY